LAGRRRERGNIIALGRDGELFCAAKSCIVLVRTAPLSDQTRRWSCEMADAFLSLFTDDEKTALVALLKRAIDAERYPLSPRIGQLRGILAKLEPPPLPPLRHYAPPRAIAKRRRG
jgi:hypothetical protein